MVKTTVKASLVGMRYHGISPSDPIISVGERAILRREPKNPHDKNAIAVEVRSKTVGHIDRTNAEILAPLLDKGGSYEASLDQTRKRTAGSIPLLIRIEVISARIPAPKIPGASCPGIYKIIVEVGQAPYIGQARDIEARIGEHWDGFNQGNHPNPVMRRLWHEKNGTGFRAEIVERAPRNLGDLALARWLYTRECHWIEHHGGLRETLNRVEPQIVFNESAKRELEQQREENKRIAKEQRKKDKERYDALKAIRMESDQKIFPLRRELSAIEKRIVAASGLRGFLFSSAEEKRRLPSLRTRAEQLSAAIKPLASERGALEEEFTALKRKLYPGRRRSAPRYLPPDLVLRHRP